MSSRALWLCHIAADGVPGFVSAAHTHSPCVSDGRLAHLSHLSRCARTGMPSGLLVRVRVRVGVRVRVRVRVGVRVTHCASLLACKHMELGLFQYMHATRMRVPAPGRTCVVNKLCERVRDCARRTGAARRKRRLRAATCRRTACPRTAVEPRVRPPPRPPAGGSPRSRGGSQELLRRADKSVARAVLQDVAKLPKRLGSTPLRRRLWA